MNITLYVYKFDKFLLNWEKNTIKTISKKYENPVLKIVKIC